MSRVRPRLSAAVVNMPIVAAEKVTVRSLS